MLLNVMDKIKPLICVPIHYANKKNYSHVEQNYAIVERIISHVLRQILKAYYKKYRKRLGKEIN
jgi:hypothetical protein